MDYDDFEDDFGAFERAGVGPFVASGTLPIVRNADAPEEYAALLNYIFSVLEAEPRLRFVQNRDRSAILELADALPSPGLKNPTALILAYFASFGGLDVVFNSLPVVAELAADKPMLKVAKPDILRYMRLLDRNKIGGNFLRRSV